MAGILRDHGHRQCAGFQQRFAGTVIPVKYDSALLRAAAGDLKERADQTPIVTSALKNSYNLETVIEFIKYHTIHFESALL